MSDLSGMSNEQLMAALGSAPAPQAPLAGVSNDDLMAMLQNHPDAPKPGIGDQVGRALGLTGRYALEGPAAALGIVADPIGKAADWLIPRDKSITDLVTGQDQSPRYVPLAENVSRLADSIGLPKPEGKLENVVGAASKGLAGTAATMGAGALAEVPALTAAPLQQALSSITGSGASEAAKQGGAGQFAQVLAGVAGGGVPAIGQAAAAATRGAFRGGEQGRQAMQNVIDDFAAAGTTPSVGQATQGSAAQWVEALLSKVPGGYGTMANKAKSQADQIGATLTRHADNLAPGTDPTVAGEAIESGITGPGGFVDEFKRKASNLYDQVDQHMPASMPVPIPATKQLLGSLTTPIKGAEATSSVLANPKLQQIASAIGEDTAKTLATGGSLPYEAVKALRTKVGSMIADAGLTSDVPTAQLKQLYGSLSTDMRTTTSQNPAAFAANNAAENFYRNGMETIEKLDRVVGKAGGPEKVFQAAMSGTREGASTIGTVMQSLQPAEANVVTSAVIRRMGRANPSAQNAVGDNFSTETFLTNWNGMDQRAKDVLFKRGGQQFAGDMDKIASVASNLRDGNAIYRNTSGTGPATAAAATGGSFILSLLSGNVGGAGAIAGGVGAAKGAASLMTSPTFVKWLAKQTTMPVGVLPAQISVLAQQAAKNKDSDALDFANQLQGMQQKPQ